MPKMLIPDTTWPIGFKDHPNDYKDVLFVAKLVTWSKPNNAVGKGENDQIFSRLPF